MSKRTPIHIRPGPKTTRDVQQEIEGQSTMALTNLLETLGTSPWQDMGEFVQEVNKSKRENWIAMKDATRELVQLATAGGIGRVQTVFTSSFEAALAPLTNILTENFGPVIEKIADAIEPLLPYIASLVEGIVNVLIPVINWIADLIQKIINIFTGSGGVDVVEQMKQYYRDYWGMDQPETRASGRRRLEYEGTF